MKRTSPFSRLVSKPASSPAFSMTGPLVFLMFVPIAFAMMFASVVLPRPGGPLNKMCSRTSPRFFAAATSSSRRSQTFTCPVNSLNIGGRSETSNAGSGSGGFKSGRLFQILGHHQFCSARFQNVIDFVERHPDQMQSQTAGTNQIVRAALHRVRFGLLPVIAQSQTDAALGSFKREADELIVPPMVGVPNNIRAGFVYSQHHEHPLAFGKRVRVQECADQLAHRREIARMAGKFDLLFFHQARCTLNA